MYQTNLAAQQQPQQQPMLVMQPTVAATAAYQQPSQQPNLSNSLMALCCGGCRKVGTVKTYTKEIPGLICFSHTNIECSWFHPSANAAIESIS